TLFTDSDLSTVCTSSCTSSLVSYRANVASACAGYTMILDTSTNTSYVPTLAVDYISGPYTIQCLKDTTTGKFCTDVIRSYNAPAGISSLPQTELCSYCVLATMNATLLNPAMFSYTMESLYDSTAKTCGIPDFNPALITSPIVSPGTSTGVNSTSPISAQCAQLGKNVTVNAASTCSAIAAQYSVSLYDVYSSNSLPQTDCSVAAGTSLCLPQACTTYTVATNDTCLGIATAANVTTVQLQTYNPSLGSTCQYLSQLVGNLICVGPHGGFPSVGATTAPIAPSGTATTLAPVPDPTAVGSTTACGEWAVAVAGDFCSTFALRYSVTLDDLYFMNPEINGNCTNLLAGFYYCVEPYPAFSTVTTTAIATTGTNYTTGGSMFTYPISSYTSTETYQTLTAAGVPAPTNVAPGTRTAAYCADYHTAVAGDTCTSIAAAQGISSADFLALNPGLTCAGLLAGVAYCDFPLTCGISLSLNLTFLIFHQTRSSRYLLSHILSGPPSNLATGSLSNCTTYYTVASGDSCGGIETKFGITLDDILAWNPWLTSSCALQIGQNLCVNGTTATSTGPPANIATGTLENCTTYYTVASGDTCTAMDAKYDIALSDLLRWNTALTSACTTIQLGEAYCVAGGGNACTDVYTVVSGDSCGAIESKFSVTLNDLLAWNPWLTSSCALQIGQNVCVSGTPSTGSTGPPANIAPGSLANCTTYYTIASGDTCTAVDTKFSLALTDLLHWNTALTSACTTIQLGEAYCVAGGGNTCPQVYTVSCSYSPDFSVLH
ncbi:hypothetical protein C8R45DRAFT_829713, partial [Mycena sanguinolenta]